MDLKTAIRTIPDYPKPGILFRDVTTLFGDAAAFEQAVGEMAAPWHGKGIDLVAGIEARGFILGGALAPLLKAGFVPLRKPGKLPFETLNEDYKLEYGTDTLHMHVDAIGSGQRVLLVDDLIATGGTALAGFRLLRRGGADIAGAGFLVDLPDLGGADLLRAEKMQVEALLSFEGH
jgi:adenine phosphoribosyltransferase